MPQRPSKVTLARPCWPFLVVTITTPLAPREPHRAVEAASFNTVIDSISFGFNEESAFEFVLGTPSITISASELFCVPEPIPRTRIPMSTPGWPSIEATCKPGIAPSSARDSVELDCELISFESIELTAPVRSFFLAVPKACTTTSSNAVASSSRVTLMVELVPAVAVTDFVPRKEYLILLPCLALMV